MIMLLAKRSSNDVWLLFIDYGGVHGQPSSIILVSRLRREILSVVDRKNMGHTYKFKHKRNKKN